MKHPGALLSCAESPFPRGPWHRSTTAALLLLEELEVKAKSGEGPLHLPPTLAPREGVWGVTPAPEEQARVLGAGQGCRGASPEPLHLARGGQLGMCRWGCLATRVFQFCKERRGWLDVSMPQERGFLQSEGKARVSLMQVPGLQQLH